MAKYLDMPGLTYFYNQIKKKFASKSDVGKPSVANTVAKMNNDKSKVYVYTGSEQGMTFGDWYYYEDGEWHSGGQYHANVYETDKTLTIENTPADAKATGDEITDLKNQLDYISTDGTNLFDKSKASLGVFLGSNGVESRQDGFYTSDYIKVAPSTQYRIKICLGSRNYVTYAWYDNTKTFLGSAYINTTDTVSFTTDPACEYIRVVGAAVKIDEQVVSVTAGVQTNSSYNRIISGNGQFGVRLVSTNDIFYNRSEGTLVSASNIYIITPDNRFNLGLSVSVGNSGSSLYWNKLTGELFTSNDQPYDVIDSNVYFLSYLGQTCGFKFHKEFCVIQSAFPIFDIDLHNNKININVKYQPAYFIYNGRYKTLAVGYSQVIEDVPNNCIIGYDIVTNSFVVINDFNIYSLNRYIPVIGRYYRNIICNYQYTTAISGTSKNIACYGDSLTFYDGNAFTWGEHEGEICIGFETYLQNELNALNVSNFGHSGYTTPQICSVIKGTSSSILSSKDIITIMGGDNDDRLNVPVGTLSPIKSTFDTSTVYGALQDTIEWMLNSYPQIRIILMTEPMGWTYRNGELQRVSDVYAQAYRDVANFYGLPLIDLWNESGINEFTRNMFYADPPDTENTYYMYHPNNDGWIRISKIIVNKIKDYI